MKREMREYASGLATFLLSFSGAQRWRFIAFAIFFTSALTFPCHAQINPMRAEEGRTLELVDQLKDVIEKSERDSRSDPRLIRQLRELVRRYDWPWRVSLLHDNFRDGDYAYNPSWIVINGDFRVVRGSGLRTVVDTQRQGRRLTDRKGENPAMDLLDAILGGARERESRDDLQTASPSAAEIYTPLSITNAFVVKLQLNFRGNAHSGERLEFGPYMNEGRNLGYRLVYESGDRASLSLLRIAPSRSAVIDTYDQGLELHDGNPHTIEWRRGNDGELVVLLDDKEIMRTVDRAHSGSFNGFSIVNHGGVYELKEISIFGTHR